MTAKLRKRYADMFGKAPDAIETVGKVAVLFHHIDGITYAVTDGVHARYELDHSVRGKPKHALLAAALVALGKRGLAGTVIRDAALPTFPGLTDARLQIDRLGHKPAGLQGLGKKLLAILPLYPAEADEIEARGDKAFADTFVKVRWDDPARKPFAGPAPGRKPPPKGKTGWDAVLAILHAQDPVEYDALVDAHGATAKQLAKLPPALHDMLRRFDGKAPLFEYTTMSCARIIERRDSLRELQRDRDLGWSDALTPFAEDGGGNLMCVDGRGRVVQWERLARGTFVRAKSVDALLAEFIAELRAD